MMSKVLCFLTIISFFHCYPEHCYSSQSALDQSPLHYLALCPAWHYSHLQSQETGKVVGLANLHTLGTNDRVSGDQMEVKVGKAVVDYRSLDGRLVCLPEGRTVQLVNFYIR